MARGHPKMELNRTFKVIMRRAVTVSDESNVKQVIRLSCGCVRWVLPKAVRLTHIESMTCRPIDSHHGHPI